MSNTAWKQYKLPTEPTPAGSEARDTSYPAIFFGSAWKRALSSADNTPVRRRVVASQHMGGAATFLVESTTPGLTQSYPEAGVWRSVAVAHAELTPGCALDVRVIAGASGHSQSEDTLDGSWYSVGGGGSVRVTATYTNAGADAGSAAAVFTLPGSLEDDYAEPDDMWSWVQFHTCALLHPVLAVAGNASERDKWSEDTTVKITVEHEGGARVVHVSVSERPFYHVRAHDEDTVVSIPQWTTDIPAGDRAQVDALDGATYEEHRFGSQRGLVAAARQSRNFGPMIACWSSYNEDDAEVTDTDPDPIQVTSTTPVGLSIGSSFTAWDEDNPGYDIGGHYARRVPENLSTRIDGAAVMPIRARVWARFTAAGSNSGYIRFQTTSRSWMTVTVSQTTTWTEYDLTGFVECNVAVDDPLPSLQDFAWVTGGTMEVRYWDAYMSDQPTYL